MTIEPDHAGTFPLDSLLLLSLECRAGRIADATERAALAAERSADALETIAALFASIVGVGTSYCQPDTIPGAGSWHSVNFLRTGLGDKNFGCDQANSRAGDDDE